MVPDCGLAVYVLLAVCTLSSESVRNDHQAFYNLASLFVAIVGPAAGVLALFVT